jgi:pimeloyl-ACP methyl ester carboxylesterase
VGKVVRDELFSPGSKSVASFIPRNPVRVLVLAHGFPWPDGSRTDSDLIGYARTAVERWAPFADTHHAVIVAPAFGGQEFPGYREMLGRSINPDEFVNVLVDKAGREHLPRFAGHFSLHGHSAGAQFAARYLVTHPGRLDAVVLSAPSTFPMPDPALPWPSGMAPAMGRAFTPEPAGWLTAATEVPVTVLVGARDAERRPAAPGQRGSTRIERAAGWADSMRRHAEASKKVPTIRFVLAEGFDHDEEAMAAPAQEVLAQVWRG